MIDARDFSPDGSHAGTENDPWPGQAIVDALKSLPQPGGGTVRVANGIWLFDKAHTINGVNDFVLQGESHDAELRFVGGEGGGQLWFGSDQGGTAGFTNGIFENLLINANGLDKNDPRSPSALRLSTGRSSEFRNNKMLGHSNGSIPAMFWEGGQYVKIHHNHFDGRQPEDGGGTGGGGDSVCQVQSGPMGADGHVGRDFEISDNTFLGAMPVVIGVDKIKVLRNHCESHYGFLAIAACGTWNTRCTDTIIDSNTVSAEGANGVMISGISNDPGGMSIIDGFQITNNTLIGTFASICCQGWLNDDQWNDGVTLVGSEKYNVLIKGNKLHSAWGASDINVRGGDGKVDGVLITENTLTNDAGKPNTLTTDDHSYNVQCYGNNGLDDTTEPEPIPPEPEPPMKNTVTITVTADPPGSVNFVTDPAMSRSATPKGKPPKPPQPPAQVPTVTIAVDVEPPDSSNIVFAGSVTRRE